jgi:hypothetical protein
MDRINIETLFPSKDGEKTFSDGKIDINTLYQNNMFVKEYNRTFNSDILLKNIIIKRKRLRKTFVEMYNKCCSRIKKMDDIGGTDLIYKIPEQVIECPEFIHEDCLNYISKYLREQHIETKIIDKYTIFITWHNIELKKSQIQKIDDE